MSRNDKKPAAQTNHSSQTKELPLRDLKDSVEDAELILLAEKINEGVARMEEGQTVSQEVLQLEFSV